MNISRRFIDYPVMTTLVMTALVLFGLFGYAELPVSELPSVRSILVSLRRFGRAHDSRE